MVPHLLGLTLGEHLAEVQAVDVVADAHDERHVVLDHADREAELAPELEQRVPEPVRLLGPIPDDGSSSSSTSGSVASTVATSTRLSTPYGRPGDPRVGQVLQAEDAEQQVGPAPQLALGAERPRQAQHAGDRGVPCAQVLGGEEVLPHRRALHQADVLEGPAHAERGALVDAKARDVVAPEEHMAAVRRVEAGDDVEGRRLARAVWPDHADDLPFADRQADVAGRLHATESDRAPLASSTGIADPAPPSHRGPAG